MKSLASTTKVCTKKQQKTNWFTVDRGYREKEVVVGGENVEKKEKVSGEEVSFFHFPRIEERLSLL